MEKRIPLHSLVFCPTIEQLNDFSQHERLSNRLIEKDLVGDYSRIEFSPVITNELFHRSQLKLSLGERVAVFSGDISQETKTNLTHIAHNQGASVVELERNFVPNIATKTFQSIWEGITVVGDVHGNLTALNESLAWAKSRNHFIWFLGDIVDYGLDTLPSMSAVYHAVMAGDAGMIIGNHEQKIAKWLDQREKGGKCPRISDGNKVTINALNRLDKIERNRWIGQFRSLLSHSSFIYQLNNITLVHAALHYSYWTKPIDKEIENFSLYGESDQNGGKYRRTYRWMDMVPQNKMVFIGHDVLHKFPIVKTNKKGGQVVCLDTGSSKGGALSSADLKFYANGDLRLECFKMY